MAADEVGATAILNHSLLPLAILQGWGHSHFTISFHFDNRDRQSTAGLETGSLKKDYIEAAVYNLLDYFKSKQPRS